jgi:sugar lactone lactonase YvrE
MSRQHGRYEAPSNPRLAEGWTLQRLTPPSLLYGANGMRVGPDGRIYIAQVSGSTIGALDPATGAYEQISPIGGAIVAPDDLDFGPDGALYATEVMDARVAVRERNGTTRVLRGDLPSANGITFHNGRLFIDECRMGGRVLELDLAGGEPRVLAEDVPMPNALEMGPDGKLYFPVLGANEIWRIDPEGGAPERVAGDLGVPDAVKFDKDGYIVSTQGHTGEVLRIDPRTGDRTTLAKLDPGLDNLVFCGERLFVSSFTGLVTEVLAGGQTRSLLPAGFNGPFGIAFADDGKLYIADGPHFMAMTPGGQPRTVGMLFSHNSPGYVRGVAALGGGAFLMASAGGAVAVWRVYEETSEVLADGFDQLQGVAVGPGGEAVAAEFGGGRVVRIKDKQVEVLASGLNGPIAVAVGSDGTCYASESGAGRVVKVSGGRAETVVDGLKTPHGIVLDGDQLYVLDAGAKTVTQHDLGSGKRTTLATDLPVGAPPGVTPKPLRGFPPFVGPMGPFAGLARGPDGTLYISADGEGSILALKPEG